MTTSQHAALCSATAEGELTWTDRRVLGALLRRGWVSEHRGRRGRRSWRITAAGRAALESSPEVIASRARPNWRSHWARERVGHGRYLVEGHEIVRPAHGMLWRLRCPTVSDEPVGLRSSLAEAVELLDRHLVGGPTDSTGFAEGPGRTDPPCSLASRWRHRTDDGSEADETPQESWRCT